MSYYDYVNMKFCTIILYIIIHYYNTDTHCNTKY